MKTLLAVALFVVASLAAAPALGSPGGELDPAFGDHGRVLLRDPPFEEFAGVEVFVDPGNGKLVVAADGYRSDRLLRFNGDGSLDQSFGNQGTALLDLDDDDLNISDVKQLVDGRLLIAGALNVYGTPDNVLHGTALLARMHADGTPDLSFGNGGRAVLQLGGTFESVSEILPQADGRIVVFGSTGRNGATENILARFTQDGLLDGSFGSGPTPGVRVINVAGIDARLNAILQQGDGKFLVCGDATLSAGLPPSIQILAIRLQPDGAPDPTFGNNGTLLIGGSQDSVEINACLELADGHLIFTGIAGSDQRQRAAAWRITPDGRLDAGFGAGGVAVLNTSTPSSATAMLVMDDGSLAIAGAQWRPDSTWKADNNAWFWWSDMLVTRIDPTTGAVDLDFGNQGITVVDFGTRAYTSNAVAASLRQQPDGKLVVVGYHADVYDWYYAFSIAMARIDPYGSGSNGWVSMSDTYLTATAKGREVPLSLRRTGGSTGTLTVDYTTVADSASAGEDYVATSGTVVWPDGDMNDKTISITVLDALVTTNRESFNVALSNASGGLAMNQATIGIEPVGSSGGGGGNSGGNSGGNVGDSVGSSGGGAFGIELLILSLVILALRYRRLTADCKFVPVLAITILANAGCSGLGHG